MTKTLEKCTFDCVNSLADYEPKKGARLDAKVLKVYDGDTVWIAYYNAKLEKYIKTKVRFSLINAAEIRGNKDETAEEKAQRVAESSRAKKLVEQIIANKIIMIEIEQTDKYGRLLADILVPQDVWSAAGLDTDCAADCEMFGVQYYDRFYVNLPRYMLHYGYAVKYS